MNGPPEAGRVAALLLVLLVAAGGCRDTGGEAEPAVIDRSVFVDTYVDLRVAALEAEGSVPGERKEAILREHGVTEDELLEFAEVRGRDAAFMRDVWNDVEAALDSIRSTGPDPGGDDRPDPSGEG